MLESLAPLLPSGAWLLVSIAFYAVGEYVSKTWANSPTLTEVAIILCASMFSSLFWLPALFERNKLADVGTAWIVLATLTTVFLGAVVFKEHLSPLQWGGVLLALCAFFLLMNGQ